MEGIIGWRAGCLARSLHYIRRKALQTKSNKNNLIIKEKKS